MTSSLHQIMAALFSTPAAPTREEWISDHIIKLCKKLDIKVFADNEHNIWLNASSLEDLHEARLAFVAHMDHPGMSVESFHAKNGKIIAKAKWLGGGPKFIEGANVILFSNLESKTILHGTIDSCTLNKNDEPDRVMITVSGIKEENLTHLNSIKPWGACLYFKVVDGGFKESKGKYITRSADDLISVCAIVDAFSEYKGKKVVALLTCSEEIGLKGAAKSAKAHLIHEDGVDVIVADLSKPIDDISPSKGPIIKRADVDTKFDNLLTEKIQKVADKAKIKYQDQKKSAGKTDADVFKSSGYKVSGIAVTLDNYHNTSKSNRPAPEEVDINDVDGLISLIKHLIESYESTD